MFFAQHQMRRVISPLAFAALLTLAASEARAVPVYTIRDLGTLPDKSNSVATSINNQGQVVGISYNVADGEVYQSSLGPRYNLSGTGTQSFLYDDGKTTRIDPVGGARPRDQRPQPGRGRAVHIHQQRGAVRWRTRRGRRWEFRLRTRRPV